MGAKGSRAKRARAQNPYKNPTDPAGSGAASEAPAHLGGHTLGGKGRGAQRTDQDKGEPGLRTSTVPLLCPLTMGDSLAVWGIVDFSDLATKPKAARFDLSVPSKSIDAFVSHVWHDEQFLNSMRLMVRIHHPTPCRLCFA